MKRFALTLLFAPMLLTAEVPRPLKHIVFGSCLDKTEHPMLDRTLTLPMDLFLYLGDNVYADTADMRVMRAKYDALKRSRFHQGVKQKAPFLATWDDHDFGPNDGGADYPMRRESQTEFLDWLEIPADSPRRKQEGVYHSAIFGPEGKRVQVIMLDTRYFRSPLKRGRLPIEPSGGKYVPDDSPEATMLGEAQWSWLENELKKPAELRLIGSSIQLLPSAHGGESWANLPHERQRFLDLLAKTCAMGVLILSGDRHWCEFSRIDGPLDYPLHDLTASSMTQIHPRGTPTPNANRLPGSSTYHLPNVGRLEINWDLADPSIQMDILDVEGRVRISHHVRLSELRK